MSRFSKPRRATKKDQAAAAAAEALVSGPSAPASVPLEAFKLEPASQASVPRRKPGTQPFPKPIQQQVVLGVGRTAQYVQRAGLPEAAEPGATALGAFLGLRQQDGSPAKLSLDDATRNLVTPGDYDDEFGNDYVVRDPHRHRRRRAKQYATWRDSVIPALVEPLLQQLHSGSSTESRDSCACPAVHTRSIVLADWEGMRRACFGARI